MAQDLPSTIGSRATSLRLRQPKPLEDPYLPRAGLFRRRRRRQHSVRALEPLVTQYDVDLIFCGHSHNYARTGAYNSAQAEGDPIALNVPHITSGGGGAPIYQSIKPIELSSRHHGMACFGVHDLRRGRENPYHDRLPGQQCATDFDLPSPYVAPSGLTISQIEQVVLNHFTNVSSGHRENQRLLYNRATKMYTGNLTITNNGDRPYRQCRRCSGRHSRTSRHWCQPGQRILPRSPNNTTNHCREPSVASISLAPA